MISLHTIPMKVRNDYCFMRVKNPPTDEQTLGMCGADRVTAIFYEEEMVMEVKVMVRLLDHAQMYLIEFFAMDKYRGAPPMLIKELQASAEIWESQDFIPYILGGIMDGKYKVRNL